MKSRSGIVFEPPRTPVNNSLINADDIGGSSFGKSRSNVPQFPPISFSQIMTYIRNGHAEVITLSEWLLFFKSEVDIDDEQYGKDIFIQVWQAVDKFDSVANIAFFLASQYLEKEQEYYPRFLLETLNEAKPYLRNKHQNRIAWLIYLSEGNYCGCHKLAREHNTSTFDFIRRLKFAKPVFTRTKLIQNLVKSLPFELSESDDFWLLTVIDDLTIKEQLLVAEDLINSSFSFKSRTENWIIENCLPNEDKTLWHKLSSSSRNILKDKYDINDFYIFDQLAKLLSELANQVNNPLNINETESTQLKSRSEFWKNYSKGIKQVLLILPKLSYQLIEEELNVDEHKVIITNDLLATEEVVIFELGEYLFAEVLRGRSAELRIFEYSSRNIERLLNSRDISLSSIRNMTYSFVHDHEYLWQYSLEKLLRTKLNILPNSGLKYFYGLPKVVGKYSHVNGLKKPDDSKLSERVAHLERWNDKFWAEEEKTSKYKDFSPELKKSYRDLAIAKNALLDGQRAIYDKYLARAANSNNPEAMYLLGVSIINNPKAPIESKKNAEDWIKQSASLGYEPAAELAKRYGLNFLVSPTKNDPYEGLGKVGRAVKRDIEGIDSRPYSSLTIIDFEHLYENEKESISLKKVYDELSRRKESARINMLKAKVLRTLKRKNLAYDKNLLDL